MNNSLKLRNRKAIALFLTKRSETLLTAIKKTAFAFLLLSGSIPAVQAQSNFKPGYIITNQQDTVTGWINFRTDKRNQKQCEFKPDLKLAVKIYLPQDIAGYRFTDEGKYYVSHEIQLNETSQKVFLEFLVKGIMNLYYYADEVDYYFFENQDGKMEVVSQQPERVDNMIIRQDNEYISRIRSLFQDYQTIVQKTEKLKFNQRSMMDVAEEYHNEVCTTGESCIIFRNRHPDDEGIRYKISVYGGLQLSNYVFSTYYMRSSKHRASNVSPLLGAQVNWMNPRWSNSFSLQLEASFSQFKSDIPKKANRYVNNDYPNVRATSYEALASSLRAGVKYTYPKYIISPTAEAGIALTYLLEEKGAGVLRPIHYGYYLALGANYKITASHAVFIRLVYENYLTQDMMQKYGNDRISLSSVKIGYTF
jgi:hypothetical protein